MSDAMMQMRSKSENLLIFLVTKMGLLQAQVQRASLL